MANQILPFSFGNFQVRVVEVGNEPLFVARDVMLALGYDVSNVPDRIKHIPDEWKGRAPIATPGGVQEMTVLTEQGLYFFVARSDKQAALPFQKWVSGEVVPSIRKTGSYAIVPQDYLSALKALVASEEAKLLANQKVAQLENQIEETRPLTEIGQAMVGQTTMIVRDWVAMMKLDYGNSVKERKVRDLLHELGYLYWTQTEPRVARAYAQFDHLFKLEVEVCSGYPRPVLKITGEGVRQLTPVVVNKFGLTPVVPL
jgi:prophage antirepressor-like protein